MNTIHIILVLWLAGLSLLCWQHIRRDQRRMMEVLERIEQQDNRIGNTLDRIDKTLTAILSHEMGGHS